MWNSMINGMSVNMHKEHQCDFCFKEQEFICAAYTGACSVFLL